MVNRNTKQRRKVITTLSICSLMYMLYVSLNGDFEAYADDISSVSTIRHQKLAFNSCAALQEYGSELPFTRVIPLEDSVKKVKIGPWVDEWFAHGVYDTSKHGKMSVEPMDFVFLWVNGSNVEFVESKEAAAHRSPLDIGEYFSKQANRFREWDELRYAIRSVFMNVPKSMLGKIYLVVPELSNQKPMLPLWLREDIDAGLLRIITHPELFGSQYDVCLPTFNSVSIEAVLYNLPELTSDRL